MAEDASAEKLRVLKLGGSRRAAFLICKVNPGHRIRIPESICGHVPWLKRQSQKAILSLAPKGGVEIRGDETASEDLLALEPKRESMQNSAWMDLVRASPLWEVELKHGPGRYLLGLPRELRYLGVLPSAPTGLAAVIIINEAFEIWDALRWYEYARQTKAKLQELLDRASDELSD